MGDGVLGLINQKPKLGEKGGSGAISAVKFTDDSRIPHNRGTGESKSKGSVKGPRGK